jgi:glycosyltransferase involved in cell wall biosynthesis
MVTMKRDPSVRELCLSSAATRIAIVIPCHNEEVTIAKVVTDFRQTVPEATIFVYDNNSTDATAVAAAAAGATIRYEKMQGKGSVVRRAFADIEADIYILVDGDDTYDASSAPAMVRLLIEQQLDMVTGCRAGGDATTYRRGHRFGNRLLTGVVTTVFGDRVSDMLSGYRVFSRRFVK